MPGSDWLPPLIDFADHGSDWATYLDAVYACFRADFIDTVPEFRGRKLRLKRHPLHEGREATFWHLVSQGETEETRVPEIRRCERIPWPKPVIINEAQPTIKLWQEPRGSELRVHMWLEAEDYLVVLARRKVGQPDEYVLPWTAFIVESGHYRRGLQKRFEKYAKND